MVEVFLETGNDVRPPEVPLQCFQLKFHLLIGIEEAVHEFIRSEAGQGWSGVLGGASEAEGLVVVRRGAHQKGKDGVLLAGGEGEAGGEVFEAATGTGFGLSGLGEVLGTSWRYWFNPVKMGRMRSHCSRGGVLV
jgi:hypothetical protein